MARVCSLSGKRTIVGNHKSRADIRTLRKLKVNLHWKKMSIDTNSDKVPKTIKIRLSTYAMRLCKYYGSITNLLRSTSKRLNLSPKLTVIRRRLIKEHGLFKLNRSEQGIEPVSTGPDSSHGHKGSNDENGNDEDEEDDEDDEDEEDEEDQ